MATKSWTCSVCTFENFNNIHCCEICGSRPLQSSGVPDQAPPFQIAPNDGFVIPRLPPAPPPSLTTSIEDPLATHAPTISAPVSDKPVSWDCAACTFTNENNIRCCELCGSMKFDAPGQSDGLPHSSMDVDEKTDETKMDLDEPCVVDEVYPDFVLKDYIRDTLDIMEEVGNLEEFLFRMMDLGIRSEHAKQKAMKFLSEILEERQKDDEKEADPRLFSTDDGRLLKDVVNAFEEEQSMIELVQRGFYLDEFLCLQCNIIHSKGIQLSLCNHISCESCFTTSITNMIDAQTVPTCFVCHSNIEISDINTHIGNEFGNIVNELLFRHSITVIQATTGGEWSDTTVFTCFSCGNLNQPTSRAATYVCVACSQTNCIRCKKVHIPPETCDSYEFFVDNKFLSFWEDPPEEFSFHSQHIRKIEVGVGTEEFNWIAKKVSRTNYKIDKIERIQNAQSWNRYSEYCDMLAKSGSRINQQWVFHGTRANHPEKIWQSLGFDLRNARIGGCLWFAVDPTYSMGGYGFAVPGTNQLQIFVCCVACGERENGDVKFIRSDAILNVFKNEATYPAYLLTYHG